MKNLFDFSATANELHFIIEKVVKVFVKQQQTDAILDMKTMYNKLYNGYPIYISVRETGFDTMERFNLYKFITNDKEFEFIRPVAVSRFCVEAYIKIYPNELRVDVMIVRRFNETDLQQIKHELLGLEPMIKVNFVEKFGE
jgi:hypothetical protein